MKALTSEDKDKIRALARKHGAENVRVFGSFARGDNRPDSDLDILVDAGAKTSSWFPAGLILDLQELLGCHVDVVTEKGLNPLIREHVMKEVRSI